MYKYTVAYGIGNEYKRYMSESLDKELHFDFLADVRFSSGNHIGDTRTMSLEELRILDDALIVVFPKAKEILDSVISEFGNKERHVQVIHKDEFHNHKLFELGRRIAYSIKNTDEKGFFFFVLRFHIGDTVNAFPYIALFKRLHNYPDEFGLETLDFWYRNRRVKRIVVLSTPLLCKLCSMCPDIDETREYSAYELEALDYFLHNSECFTNIYPDENVISWLRHPVFDGRMQFYPYRIYDLPLNNPEAFSFVESYRCVIGEIAKKDATEVIQRLDISIKRTVIIFPYAKSSSEMNSGFWEEYALWLKKSGYRVFTNIGPGEIAVNGTEELRISVNTLISLASRGIALVGVQCGVLDAVWKVVKTNLKCIVVWPLCSEGEKLYAMEYGVLCPEGDRHHVSRWQNVLYITFNIHDKKKMDTEYMWNILKEKTRNFLFDNTSVVLFGAGYYGRLALGELGCDKVDFFVDNSTEKAGSNVLGISVFSFAEKVEEIKNKSVIICMALEKCAKVKEQLDESGISDVLTIFEYRRKQISDRISDSKVNIETYNKAIKWVYRNTIKDKGIINYTGNEKSEAYPEVTGYFIPSLIRWGHRELAKQYTRWLCAVQNEDGSFGDVYGDKPYIFDTAQIIKGLLAAREIGEGIDESIIRGCDWILSCIDEEGRLVQEDTSAWDFKQNPDIEMIHIYCLSPLIEAGKTLRRDDYIQSVQKIWSFYEKKYKDKILNYGMLSHFYAYVIEGLIDIGEEELAREAMHKIKILQRDDGSIPGMPGVNWICSTGMFQFAVIWYRLGDTEHGKKAFDLACKLQNKSGGWFGSYPYGDTDENLPYLPNQEISWAIKFFLDALYYKNVADFNDKHESFLNDLLKNDERFLLVKDAIESVDARIILDVGCGKGRYLFNLMDVWKGAYHAVDISAKVMEKVPRDVEKKNGTLTNLPYPDDMFDLVYTCEALEHAVDTESAIREMTRVTRPGGKICIIDKNAEMLGVCSIEEWEQWFDIDYLKKLMEKYCKKVDVFENLGYESEADNVFCGWIGEV